MGLAAQFGENGFVTNKGNSTYHGLLTTVQKNFSHGLQLDFNYTLAHSIDNVSLIANVNPLNNGFGFVCDATNGEACRGNSDFDVTNYIAADFVYQLPFGKGRMFGSNVPLVVDEFIGGWDVSGITNWHSGVAYSTVSNAFLAGFANDDPAIFNGDRAVVSPHAHKTSSGSINVFSDQTTALGAFRGPIGLEYGSRNNLRGPSYINQNLGLAKRFRVTPERVSLKFRADAFLTSSTTRVSPIRLAVIWAPWTLHRGRSGRSSLLLLRRGFCSWHCGWSSSLAAYPSPSSPPGYFGGMLLI